MIQAATIPAHSLIQPYAARAGFRHCQVITLDDRGLPAMAHFLRLMRRMPGWIDSLMVLRNRLVNLLGLKDLGRLTGVDAARSPDSYQPGERVGIFTLVTNTDDEVLLVDSDRHLDVHIALMRRPGPQPGQCQVLVTTVVRTHNLLGRLYMLPVAPFHRLITPIALRRLRD
ncbi:hypothetical protein CCOS865_02956 [Pseudomonas reidholzensis]|uniref:DUF2867 domain-containing protein n=1 Tax=Pseudomonas reidholzensis TaxID=1785162 RepID=A0A383RUH1_9PSED|nr:DUF2867 domain-containing protein [Pseudomonas reidholzensis]SYX90689.1 hypothetical protein CCOS865_02956 [Pseudomonas reidholzensis]